MSISQPALIIFVDLKINIENKMNTPLAINSLHHFLSLHTFNGEKFK